MGPLTRLARAQARCVQDCRSPSSYQGCLGGGYCVYYKGRWPQADLIWGVAWAASTQRAAEAESCAALWLSSRSQCLFDSQPIRLTQSHRPADNDSVVVLRGPG